MARKNSTEKKSAIIPYRFWNDQLQILFVTPTSDRKHGRKWVIPKGKVTAHLEPQISATKEAVEEAGVLGKLHPICVGQYRENSQGDPIPTFLLEVTVEFPKKNWKENTIRKRKWVNANNCDTYIRNTELLDIINDGARCLRSLGAYFQRAIETFCEEYKHKKYKYELYDQKVNENRAVLEFSAPTKPNKFLYITRENDGSTIKFIVSDIVVFDSKSNYRDAFSTLLLRHNFKTESGFWCIEKINDEFKYYCIHNTDLKLLDNKYFAKIVEGLFNESNLLEMK